MLERGRRPAIVMLAVLALVAGCEPATDQAAEASHKVDALFAPFTEGRQPGAAVMVIRNGKVVHQAGYGYADLDTGTPITPQSAFRLASVSKQFTAMAIVALAEDGVLDYDDPVSDWLPALSAYDGVAIRHLLSHTGGYPDYYDSLDTSRGMPTTADAMTHLAAIGEPVFPPGERYEYSNPGYEMLALIVEAASGKDFATFMRERVFDPAGMTGARIFDETEPELPTRVIGYDAEGTNFVENDYDPLNHIVGSGGTYASMDDFYGWDRALDSDAIVSQAAIAEAFTPVGLNNGESTGYGFGWTIDDYRGMRRVRHGGSWVGFRTHIARYPDDALSIVVLTNRSDGAPERYIDPLTDIYLGTE